MLVLDRSTGEIRHDEFRRFGDYLRPGDLVVLNNTKVIPARIWSQKPNVELLLVENLGHNRWSALVKPGHRAKPGVTLFFTPWLSAVVESEAAFGGRMVRFKGDVEKHLVHHGTMPLPPYIERPATADDRERYQTVYASQPGAVAAPTAGLHFTTEMLARIPHAFLTLHVGIGTFRPVKTEWVADHRMHAEHFMIPQQTAEAIQQAKRVVAIGTTVTRALESAGKPRAMSGSTDLFIKPGFEFRMVNALLTNFHLPRSTLLMLVSAFAGRERVLRAYEEAVRERYRFFSYGDCMLIL